MTSCIPLTGTGNGYYLNLNPPKRIISYYTEILDTALVKSGLLFSSFCP